MDAWKGEGEEKKFPVDVLASLDEQLNRPRWVVPVLPKGELEKLLEASIKLVKAGLDSKSEPCQRFFRDGLTLSFMRLIDDDAVNAWNPDIQIYIFNNAKLLVRLCAAKIDQDSLVLLKLLALVFNPRCKWNMINMKRNPEKLMQSQEEEDEEGEEEVEVFGTPPKHKAPCGWLCDLINIFGEEGGFRSLHRRICRGTEQLTFAVVTAHIRPFANCIDYLTDYCVVEYIAPVVATVLVSLGDEAVKKDSSTEAEGDAILSILKVEGDKEDVLVTNVLEILWTLAKRDDCTLESLDHALKAHLKILTSSAQDHKMHWLQRCVSEVETGKWIIPALKHFREVASLYPEPPLQFQYSQSDDIYYRTEVLQYIDREFRILAVVIESLEEYMDIVSAAKSSDETIDPETYCADDRFNHFEQVQRRLDFVEFVLRDGSLWLNLSHSLIVWQCLAEVPVFSFDQEACLQWFIKLIEDEPDLEPETMKHIFISKLMKLDPQALTYNGFFCFDCCFHKVNLNDFKLRQWRRTIVTDSLDLMGLEYLWEVMLNAKQDIAHKAIDCMKGIYSTLTPQLMELNKVPEEFLCNCFQKVRLVWDKLVAFKQDSTEENVVGYQKQVVKLTRCLCLLKNYAAELDERYINERCLTTLGRSNWGSPIVIQVNFSHSQGVDDLELPSHTNETIAAVRRNIKKHLKLASYSHFEVYCGADIIIPQEDYKHVSTLTQGDRMTLQVKVVSMSTTVSDGLAHDSSFNSDRELPVFTGPTMEAEHRIPSVLIATTQEYTQFLLKIDHFALKNGQPKLRDSVRDLLRLVPSENTVTVIFPYNGNLKDDLPMKPGNVITVNDWDMSKDWGRGTLNGKIGLFFKAFTKRSLEVPSSNDYKLKKVRGDPEGYEATYRGREYTLKEKLEEVDCIICQEVAGNAHQTSCCGSTLCLQCASMWRNKNNSCPQCRKKPLRVIEDPKTQRRITGATVYCPNYHFGCDFIDGFGRMAQHLKADCEFEGMKCPHFHCDQVVPKKFLSNHVSEMCLWRNVACPGCGVNSEITYHDIITRHHRACPKWPAQCPHSCTPYLTLTQSIVDSHLMVECPQAVIDCSFSEVGCKVKVKRKDMPEHIRDAMSDHLTAVLVDHMKVKHENEELKRELIQLKRGKK